jgi:hypothetical protein
MAMVCEWFNLKTTQTIFTGLASKLVATVSSGLTSKPAVMVSGGLALKPAATVFSGLSSKPVAMVSLASKLETTICWFGPQNQVSFGLLVVPQN